MLPDAKNEDGRHYLPPGEGEAAERWREDALKALQPTLDRIERLGPALAKESDCELFATIIGASARTHPSRDEDGLYLKYEYGAYALDVAEELDPQWRDKVRALDEPGVVEPFFTRFGLHLVYVPRLEPARLADGSMDEAGLKAAREDFLREQIHEVWQAERLRETLKSLRERRVVRLAPEVSK